MALCDRGARGKGALAVLRRALGKLCIEERIEAGSGGLLATAYHLIERGQESLYLSALEEARQAEGLRVSASGPWAPYAFAPELEG